MTAALQYNELSVEAVAQHCNIHFLYHMTHIQNLESILNQGLLSHNQAHQNRGHNVVDISNRAVNARRSACDPIYGKSLHSYVPFYFNPRNAMLYKTQCEYGNSVVLLAYDYHLLEGALVTNQNAACNGTQFSANYQALTSLNWQRIFEDSWYQDEQLKREMMAEVLVPQQVGIERLQYIFCGDPAVTQIIQQYLDIPSHVKVVTAPQCFFRYK